MNSWRMVQRGRQQQQGEQGRYRDNQQKANMCMANNSWPVRPTQMTLDRYLNHTTTDNQQRPEVNQRLLLQNIPWGDRDPNEQGPGPRPGET